MIPRAAAPSSHCLSHIPPRTLSAYASAAVASPSWVPTQSQQPRQQRRHLATVQDDAATPPPQAHGGLKDSDRIFQNLYGRHGPDLASARKCGDWHKTKEIVLKGHDWV